MSRKTIFAVVAIVGMSGLAVTNPAQAFFGNMMNPNKWFDDDDDHYYRRRGYGYGPYGGGWGGPYGGYGPYGGWGGGPWGGGYGAPSTIVVNPSAGSSSKKAPRLPE